MDKNCDNCKFTNYDVDDWPCDECVCGSNWQDGKYRSCESCKFEPVNLEDQPCYDCMSGIDHWTPPITSREEMLAKLNTYCFYENVKYHGCEDCPGCVFNSVCKIICNFDDMSDAMLKKAVKLIESPEPKADLDEPTNDPVNHPNHYCQGGIECIDAMEAAFGKQTVANFCICNAFKYIFRCKNKNGLEDVKKARWYLDKYLELYDEMM